MSSDDQDRREGNVSVSSDDIPIQQDVHTGGGVYIGGNVDTGGGAFTGRDRIVNTEAGYISGAR